MNRYPKMTALAGTFPTLATAAGVEPFEQEELDKWAAAGNGGSGARHAARFLLHVFNSNVEWESGPFVLSDAMACWDAHHRAAFVAWCKAPWWP